MMKQLAAALMTVILVGNACAQSRDREPQRSQTTPGVEIEAPKVLVESQPDAPLRITSAETRWATPDKQMVEIYVVVKNVSDRNIRAYLDFIHKGLTLHDTLHHKPLKLWRCG